MDQTDQMDLYFYIIFKFKGGVNIHTVKKI